MTIAGPAGPAGRPRGVRLQPDRRAGLRPLALFLVLIAGGAACGKKGPPLPPFVRLPGQPAEFVAERRGDRVAIRFAVPGANADGTRPANVERVDVYAITAPRTMSDDDIQRHGDRIASVRINPPPDPEEPDRQQVIEGAVDQGAVVTLSETLTPASYVPIVVPVPAGPPANSPQAIRTRAEAVSGRAPLLPALAAGAPTRLYLAVPVGARGRIGSRSRRGIVPLVAVPATPSRASITYDEQEVTVTWSPPAAPRRPPAVRGGLVPSRPLALTLPPPTYHVYEVPPEGDVETETRLTTAPVEAPPFIDARVTWGLERCYAVRAAQSVGTLAIESDAAPPTCVTLTDTFAPPPPSGLTTVPSDGAISLIWDPSAATDLDGYLVLRGQPGGTLTPVTPAPVRETSFRDTVPSGSRVVYAVQAVDTVGNVSQPSATVEDTAR